MPRLAVVALLAAGVALSACGDGDDNDKSSGSSSQGDCAASFNSAPGTFRRLAAFSHAPNNNVITGNYDGKTFTAHSYDHGLRPDTTTISVKSGDCVVTEISPSTNTVLYTFVEVDGSWHRLSETDPASPLSKGPKEQLSSIQSAQLQGTGPEAQLATAD